MPRLSASTTLGRAGRYGETESPKRLNRTTISPGPLLKLLTLGDSLGPVTVQPPMVVGGRG
jgi:hypothetical protein